MELMERLARKGAEVELAELRERMKPLEALLARGPRPGRAPQKKRRTMSKAARKAIGDAQRARWAALKGNKKAPAPVKGKGR